MCDIIKVIGEMFTRDKWDTYPINNEILEPGDGNVQL